jgi:uncharacterized SAM-binding protein YcdF (DUF218 family)
MSVVFAVVAVLGIGAWMGREWLLRSAGDLWIVSDPLGPADAVAIFGGGLADRPLAAARYYRQGLVTNILVSDDRQALTEKAGIVTPELAANEILLKLGTPESAIATFGHALGNTRQEAFALRAWAEQHNLHSVIVPTQLFSTRRARWMLRRVFPREFQIRVIALDTPDYRKDDWWCRMQGITAFKNDVIKYLYYELRY